MFGKRALGEWSEMVREIRDIDRVKLEESPEVARAMEEVKFSIMLAALPPIQKDLWESLERAFGLGGNDLLAITYEKSGCNLTDLLDLYYIAYQLSYCTATYIDQYDAFADALEDLILEHRGHLLDREVSLHLGKDIDQIEGSMLWWVEDLNIVRRRLGYYAKFKDPEVIEPMVSALEILSEDDDGISGEEAKFFLNRLAYFGVYFDEVNVRLVDEIRDRRYLRRHLGRLMAVLSAQENLDFRSDFDSIIARIIPMQNQQTLRELVNSGMMGIYNERLLALAKLKSVEGVSEEAVYQLMLPVDAEGFTSEMRFRQQELRKQILASGLLKEMGMGLGFIPYSLAGSSASADVLN